MTLDEYQLCWTNDAPISPDDLDGAARHVPVLHAKYWRFYANERLRFKKLELEFKVLTLNKHQWYNGKMIDEDRLALGWAPNPVKLLSADIPRHLDADADIQAMTRNKILLEETLRFLEDVIKQINGRGYYISTAVNFLKFKMGV